MVGPARSFWYILWRAIWHMCLSGIISDNSRLPCYDISFGFLSGISGYCVFLLSVWHPISPRRVWSRSGGHHSDPGFAVEVRRGEEDEKEERSGWHRISQPGRCRWRDNTNKVNEQYGSTIQAAQSLPAMVFYSIKGHGHAVWGSKDSKNEWIEIISTSPYGLNPCLLLPPKLQVSVQSQKSDLWAPSCKVEVSSGSTKSHGSNQTLHSQNPSLRLQRHFFSAPFGWDPHKLMTPGCWHRKVCPIRPMWKKKN